MKATRRFVDRRLKSYCEEIDLFVGERDEREKKVKRMKDPENPGKWEDRRFVLDTKLRQLFPTPDDIIDQLSLLEENEKAEEEGEFSDGWSAFGVSVFRSALCGYYRPRRFATGAIENVRP